MRGHVGESGIDDFELTALILVETGLPLLASRYEVPDLGSDDEASSCVR